MSGEHILAVDDEEDILELVRYNLERDGYKVTGVTSGEKALEAARDGKPDAVLLDLMLPGLSGYEVCRQLKGNPETQAIPIIMLTAKGEESDVVAGLELGAEDYITKPFSPRILVARLRAVLRRVNEPALGEQATVRIRDLVVDPGRHDVSVAGNSLVLTHTEFKLLHCLARRPGWVFTRDQLIESTRGESVFVTDRTIDVHVAGLRKKLGKAASYIETIRGVGYRFKE
jgi:two-component system alkaline phosphatase synthesis response regulator PhoP